MSKNKWHKCVQAVWPLVRLSGVLVLISTTTNAGLLMERQETAAKDNRQPEIVSNGGGDVAQLSIAAGGVAITSVQGSDLDGDDLSYHLLEGPDRALFDIDPQSGLLRFKTSAVHHGYFGDNHYQIRVAVRDPAGLQDWQGITLRVVRDSDGDGVDDHEDLDVDNDAIPNTLEGRLDSDGDGILNLLDLDADGDGWSDLQESGADAQYLDGDGDGRIDKSFYVGRNGIADVLEQSNDSATFKITWKNSDEHGAIDAFQSAHTTRSMALLAPELPLRKRESPHPPIVQRQDVIVLAVSRDNPLPRDNPHPERVLPRAKALVAPNPDWDGDGLSNVLEGMGDLDRDGVANAYDLDSDNDGLLDLHEALPSLVAVELLDADNDGRLDPGESLLTQAHDQDGDGVADFLDIDSDGDGILDVDEARGRVSLMLGTTLGHVAPKDFNGALNVRIRAIFRDGDADGLPNHRDLDADGDGLPDVLEAGLTDFDGDGLGDELRLVTDPVLRADLPDYDGDRVPDVYDLDSDQDGLSDVQENNWIDRNGDGRIDDVVDLNGDGYHDAHARQRLVLLDTDNDRRPNYIDRDSDADGLSDVWEFLGRDAGDDGVVDAMTDQDGDGLEDSVDVTLSRGPDRDLDGVDDRFDADLNGDGVTDLGRLDGDGDGIHDAGDIDANGDGWVDVVHTEVNAMGSLARAQAWQRVIDPDSLRFGPHAQLVGGGLGGALLLLGGVLALRRGRQS